MSDELLPVVFSDVVNRADIGGFSDALGLRVGSGQFEDHGKVPW